MKIKAIQYLVLACSLTLWAGGYDPESLQDKMCDTPENVTGANVIGESFADSASIAWDGSAYGVVFAPSGFFSLDNEIFFARVAADGTILSGPVQITDAAEDRFSPSIVWDGTGYAIAWNDYRDGATDVSNEIYFCRISRSGVKIGNDVRLTTTPDEELGPPVLVWNGSGYAIAYQINYNTAFRAPIMFLRIDEAGAPINSPIVVDNLIQNGNVYDMAWNGFKYAVVYDGIDASLEDKVFGTTIEADGTIDDQDREIDSTGGCRSIAVTAVSYNFVVAWVTEDPPYQVHAQGRDRFFLDYWTTLVSIDTEYKGYTDIVWTGAEIDIFYCQGNQPLFARLSALGTRLATEIPLGSGVGGENLFKSGYAAFGTLGGGFLTFIDGSYDVAFAGLGCHGDTTPPPCPPVLQSTAQTVSSVSLAWIAAYDTQSEIAYYNIYRNATFLARTTDRTYTDTGLSSGTAYNYYVTATNAHQWESSGCAPLSISTTSPLPCVLGPLGDAVILHQSTSVDSPSSVWDGSAYGAVWAANTGVSTQLYFSQVTAGGAILSGPTQITSNGGNSTNPSLVWTGSAYGVAYQTDWSGTWEIEFLRVDAAGELVTGSTIPLTSAVDSQTSPSLAWTGTEYGLVWGDRRSGTGYDLGFARIDASGAEVPGSEIIAYDPATSLTDICLAWNGTGYGVSYSILSEVHLGRFSPTGTYAGQTKVSTGVTSDHISSLVWTGVEYGLAWSGYSSQTILYFARLNITGALLGSVRTLTGISSNQDAPSLAWYGSAYGLTYIDDRTGSNELYFTRLDASGNRVDCDQALTAASQNVLDYRRALSASDNGFGAAFKNTNPMQTKLISIGIDDDTTPPSCPEAPHEVNREWSPDAVTIGWGASTDTGSGLSHYEVYRDWVLLGITTNTAWRDATFDPAEGYVYDIVAVDATGLPSTGCPSVDTTDPTPPTCPSGLTSPAQGYNSISLAWAPSADPESGIADYKIYRTGVFVGNTGGTTYSDTGLEPGTSYSYTVIAVNAAGLESPGCAGAAFTTLGPEECLWGNLSGAKSIQTSNQTGGTSAVWNGGEYAMVWCDDATGNRELYFARFSASGTLLSGPLQLTTDANYKSYPSLVWNGSNYAVAWEDWRNGMPDIYAMILGANGPPGSAVQVTTDANSQGSPCLVWNGTGYGVVWTDDRNAGFDYDIYFVRLDAGMTPTGGEKQVAAAMNYQLYPSLAWTGSGYGVAYRSDFVGQQICFKGLDANGNAVTAEMMVTAGGSTHSCPSLVWTAGHFGLAWYDNSNGNYDIYFARLGSNGSKIGSEVRVTTDGNWQMYPSLVVANGKFGVAWQDMRNGGWDIYFAALNDTGIKTQAEIRLTSEGSNSTVSPRTLAAGSNGFCAVWANGDVMAADYTLLATIGCSGDTTPPACPQAPHETGREWWPAPADTVTISWGASADTGSGFSHYEVYRDWVLLAKTTSTSYKDTTFNHAAGFIYDIVAVNGAGLKSSGCASVDTSDTTPPTCPENIMATLVQADRVDLSWLPSTDNLSGFSIYTVYRDNVWIDYASGTTYSDLTVSGGKTYNYAIVPNDYAGNARFDCQTLWVSTSPITLHITKNADRVNADLDWTDVNINQYVVYRSTDPQAFSELKRVPTNETIDTVLQDGVKIWYYYIQQKE